MGLGDPSSIPAGGKGSKRGKKYQKVLLTSIFLVVLLFSSCFLSFQLLLKRWKSTTAAAAAAQPLMPVKHKQSSLKAKCFGENSLFWFHSLHCSALKKKNCLADRKINSPLKFFAHLLFPNSFIRKDLLPVHSPSSWPRMIFHFSLPLENLNPS